MSQASWPRWWRRLYLHRAKPTYLGGMMEMASARRYPFWCSFPAEPTRWAMKAAVFAPLRG